MLDNTVQTDKADEVGLQTVTDSGSPVPRRVTSPAAARAIYKDFKNQDDTDARRRATIQGMIDGNSPYDNKELEEAGLAGMTNVNFMSMRANLDTRAAAAHEIFAEVPTLIELKPRAIDPNDQLAYEHAAVIADEFTVTVRSWKKFLPYMDQVFRESDAYGIGFVLFPDEFDWRFKSFRRGSLMFSPTASVEVAENDIYMIRDTMRAGELFDRIESEGAAKLGWKVEDCRKLLVHVFKQGDNGARDEKYPTSYWESLQQMRRNSDPDYESKQFELVRIVHLLVREVASGKVTHQIMPEAAGAGDIFLFEKQDRYDDMGDAIWWVPFNYADGYARSVRGVASYMAPHDDLGNRFLCRVFDAGFMTSSLLLHPRTQTDLSRLELVRHGMFTIIPPDLEAVQSTFQPQIAPLVQLRQVSENVQRNNTGTNRIHPEAPSDSNSPKTARQIVEEASKEARYEKATVAHRYDQLDILYKTVFRKMVASAQAEGDLPGSAEAKEFVKRCVDRGVPKASVLGWEKKYHVSATRAIGMGSLSMKYDITNQVLQARAMMDEKGQVNAFRDWLAVRVGQTNVDRYRPMVNRDQIPSNEHSIATLENNDMLEGSDVVVGTDQMHVIHVTAHMSGALAPLFQQVQTRQYQDPMQVARRLSVTINHIAKHLAILSQDQQRKPFVDQVTDALKKASALIPKLQREAQKLQQQAQQQQQQQAEMLQQAEATVRDRELEAKILEINRKYQVEMMKQESLNAARQQKTEEQMAIRRQQAAADVQLKRERQEAEIALEAQRAARG